MSFGVVDDFNPAVGGEVKIWFFTPYDTDKNLGKAYNEYCRLVPESDWICLMDGDCMFLNSNFGHIATQYIKSYPKTALFIPVVNRVGKNSQCYGDKISQDPDIRHHKKIADKCSKKIEVKNMNHIRLPSMPCFLFSKKLWTTVGGFDETGRILGVDVRFSQKAMKVGDCLRMNGLYMFHYYRLNEGVRSLDHVK
jgi:GT2 family glycosyltransferase